MFFGEGASLYRDDFKMLPKGDNASITRQLFGLNPKHKQYTPLCLLWMFDEQGNLLDPWLKPYHFQRTNGKLRPTLKAAGNTEPLQATKLQRNKSDCYVLALGIRILIEQMHKVPPQSQIAHLLIDWDDRHDPLVYISADGKNTSADKLFDRWGHRFVIRINQNRIYVSSTGANYTAVERF